MRARSLFPLELLYSEGDTADEIFFVSGGSFRLFKDMSRMLDLPEDLIDPLT
jgi:CRP-like cAMP-binding protein